MYIGYLETPIGVMIITANENSVLTMDYIEEEMPDNDNSNSVIDHCKDQVRAYFAGDLEAFDIPYELVGTKFQKRVWEYLLTIPYDHVTTYKEVAIGIGNEKAIRAVANAIGANKHVIFVPCHRVIGSNGSLTGFRCGLDRKKYLLELEKSTNANA